MEGGAREEIERLTGEGLAEGCRLAHEAREAIRSRYEDWMMVTVIGGLLLWAAMLLAIVLSGAISAGPWVVLASFLAVAGVCAPLLLLCRGRFRRKLGEQDRWMARLSGPRHDAVSTFDLLVEVSEQVPAWLTIKQKNRFGGHPFLTTAMFISGAAVAYISIQTWAHLGDSSFPYLVLLLLPFLALLIASAAAERSAVRRERESVLAMWKVRMEASRRTMEEMLGGL